MAFQVKNKKAPPPSFYTCKPTTEVETSGNTGQAL